MPAKFICSNCGKHYKEKIWYKKHIEKCKLINVLDKKHEMTNKELTKIVQYLVETVKDQEITIKSLQRWAGREKKKCNIIDWLNSCYCDTIHINRFLNKIIISEKQMDYVFKHGFVEGITTILQNLLVGKDIPIRCFDKDKNKFYIKQDTWICNSGKFNNFINEIVKILLLKLSEWANNNKKIILDEKKNTIYLDNLQVLMISGETKKNKYNSIQKKIYPFLKESLKSIVEYEFTF